MIFRDTRIPDSSCPYCFGKLSGAASFDGYTPNPNDISVCIYCLKTLVFNDEMHLRAPVEGELTAAHKDEAEKVRQKLIAAGIRRKS